MGVELVSFGTHQSLNHKTGYIICPRIPLFPPLIVYFLCEQLFTDMAVKLVFQLVHTTSIPRSNLQVSTE